MVKKVQTSGKKIQISGKKVQTGGKKVQTSGKKVQTSGKKGNCRGLTEHFCKIFEITPEKWSSLWQMNFSLGLCLVVEQLYNLSITREVSRKKSKLVCCFFQLENTLTWSIH